MMKRAFWFSVIKMPFYSLLNCEEGVFQTKKYMDALGMAVQEKAPSTDLMMLKHYQWYSFRLNVPVFR